VNPSRLVAQLAADQKVPTTTRSGRSKSGAPVALLMRPGSWRAFITRIGSVCCLPGATVPARHSKVNPW